MQGHHVIGRSLEDHSRLSSNYLHIEEFIKPIKQPVWWYVRHLHTNNKKIATARIYAYMWQVMCEMVIKEHKRVKIPYTSWYVNAGLIPNFQKSRQEGHFKGTDFIKTDFRGSYLYIQGVYNNMSMNYEFWVNGKLGREFKEYVKTNIVTTSGNAEAKDVRIRIKEKFPFLDYKDIEHIFIVNRYLITAIKLKCFIRIGLRGFSMIIGKSKAKLVKAGNRKSRMLDILNGKIDMYIFFNDKQMKTFCKDNKSSRSKLYITKTNTACNISYANRMEKPVYIFKLKEKIKDNYIDVKDCVYIGMQDDFLHPAMIGTKDIIKWVIKQQ